MTSLRMGCSEELRALGTADPGEVQPHGTSTARGLPIILHLTLWTTVEGLTVCIRFETAGQVQS